jgi:hypothetical protein
VGDFELEKILQFDDSLNLKVPQIGGFRGRRTERDDRLIDLCLHGSLQGRALRALTAVFLVSWQIYGKGTSLIHFGCEIDSAVVGFNNSSSEV